MFDGIKSKALVIDATLEEAMAKQGNLVHPTKRPAERDSFYEGINQEDFIKTLEVGIQLKDRIKSLIPAKIVKYLKRI